MNLEISGLRLSLPRIQLEADFKVERGERAVLQGPSGFGKTTLLRWIAGLEEVQAGEVRIGEKTLTSLPPQKRNIGYAVQEQNLFPALSILENAVFGLRVRGVPRQEREKIGLQALERLGLADRAHDRPGPLSGGERQRAAFLRAVLWKPDVLLLDEPFSALDDSWRKRMQTYLLEFHQQWSCPVLFISHDQKDADALATARVTFRYITETDSGIPAHRFFRADGV